jgi:hypothetical protein
MASLTEAIIASRTENEICPRLGKGFCESDTKARGGSSNDGYLSI